MHTRIHTNARTPSTLIPDHRRLSSTFCTIFRYINCLRYADSLYTVAPITVRRSSVIEGAPSTRRNGPPRAPPTKFYGSPSLDDIQSPTREPGLGRSARARARARHDRRPVAPKTLADRCVLYKYITKKEPRSHPRQSLPPSPEEHAKKILGRMSAFYFPSPSFLPPPPRLPPPPPPPCFLFLLRFRHSECMVPI